MCLIGRDERARALGHVDGNCTGKGVQSIEDTRQSKGTSMQNSALNDIYLIIYYAQSHCETWQREPEVRSEYCQLKGHLNRMYMAYIQSHDVYSHLEPRREGRLYASVERKRVVSCDESECTTGCIERN